MMMVSLIVCASAVLTASAVLFVIGKFNQLVSLRRKIATEMLQLDFALRLQCEEWRRTSQSDPEILLEAERLSHRAVSEPLSSESLKKLDEAAELILPLCAVADVAGGPIREASQKIRSLTLDYNEKLRTSPVCRLIARVLRYEDLDAAKS